MAAKKADRIQAKSMQIEPRKIEELKPRETNPRIHSDDQIKQIMRSIQEFGWVNPVIIDKDGGIVAGHARVEAATKLGLKEVPCLCASSLTKAQVKAYVIADNKLTLNGGWDEAILKMELLSLKDYNIDFTLTGFGQFELNEMINPDEPLPEDVWDGMPEFESKDLVFRTILVHFKNQKDVDNFSVAMKQPLTPKTKFIWFPKAKKEPIYDKEYRDTKDAKKKTARKH